MKLLQQTLWADRYGTPALVLRLLAENVPGFWRHYALVLVLLGITAGCTAVFAYLMGHVVNEAFVYHDLAAIVGLCIVTILLFTVRGLASYGQAVTLARISNKIAAENQLRMVDKLLRKNLDYFAQQHSSELVTRVSHGAGAVSVVLNMLIIAIGRDVLTLIGLVIVMLVQDPWLSLLVLAVVLTATLLVRNLGEQVRKVAQTQYLATAGMLEATQEALRGIVVVKTFALEPEMRKRVQCNIEIGRRASDASTAVLNRSAPLMELIGGVGVALVLLYGSYRVIGTGISPGAFLSLVTAFLLAYQPAKRLARLHLDLNNCLLGVRQLFELLDSADIEPDDSGKPELVVTAGRIDFRDVEFSYRADEPVIRGLSFAAEPGCTTALVGHSGGGKSTILRLIPRLHEIDAGVISIDGQSLALVSRTSLRRQIAFVGQDAFLFRGSIRENLALGKTGVGEDQIIAAAKAAHAHEFITSFADGYDTQVGEQGQQLSAGQRQRLSIARALLKDAPIILLDEATASLDNESERAVQDAIAHLCHARTTIVVAHRLHTIMTADCIHVVDGGTVVESGCHDELLRRNGRYAFFYHLGMREGAPSHAEVTAVRGPSLGVDAIVAPTEKRTAALG